MHEPLQIYDVCSNVRNFKQYFLIRKQERVCSLKDRLGGGLYIDIFSVKNVGIESIYRKMPYKKTLFLLYFWLLLGF